MRGKQFGWILSGASALGALCAAFLVSQQMDSAAETPGGRVLWVGAFLALAFAAGFLALQLAISLNGTYKVERPRMCWVAFVVACALVFGIGAGGQYLFMYSKEEIVESAEVDMVLLLDASSSMDAYGYTPHRTEAACQFVDSLNKDCRLQVMAFAGRVLEDTQLLEMDKDNKESLKQMIAAIDASGATDFNEPLNKAKNTLDTQGRRKCNKAVILLTDGDGYIGADVMDDYANSDIRVFTIRISSGNSLNVDAQALADFAKSTGGFDTQLTPKSDGSIDTADMLQAFQDAFEATSETEVNMREELIIYAPDGVTMWQTLIRVLVMVLCAMVIGVGYFGVINLPMVIGSGVMGLAAAMLVTALEGTAYYLCVLAVVVLVETAYVFLDLRGEDRFNV